MAGQSLIPSSPKPEPTAISTHPIRGGSNRIVHNTLATASNLANLLPTGTVLAFQALIPSFTNNGKCHVSNHYLTTTLLTLCSIICFFSSFTDSFTLHGKLYYGIATTKGLYVFNGIEDSEGNNERNVKDFDKYKLKLVDFVHAFVSLIVFIVFGFSNSGVQGCFFPQGGEDFEALTTNLPLGVGVLSSFLFTVFPTTRRGIGYSDMVPQGT